MVKTKQNLVGMKFGRLTVVSQSEDFIDCGRKIAGWNVFCECNSDKIFPVRQKRFEEWSHKELWLCYFGAL